VRPLADKENAALQIFNTVGEGASELCALVETDEKKLVLWIGSLEKLQGGFLGLSDFVGHTPAEIEDYANGYGDVFRREILNLLLYVIFEDTEVVGLQPHNHAVMWVGHRKVDERQFHVNTDGLTLLTNDPARRVTLHLAGQGGLGNNGRGEIKAGHAKV